MNNSEIAHTFAHRNYGTNGGREGSNLFSREANETLYSYGYHFPICSHIRAADHAGYELLFTNQTYSNSTAKHINHAWSATHHLKTLHCYNPEKAKQGRHAENLSEYMREALENGKAYRGKDTRADDNRLSNLLHNIELFSEYKKAFKLTFADIKKAAPDALSTYRKLTSGGAENLSEKAKEIGAKHQARKRAQEKKAKAAAIKEAREALPKWLATGKMHHSLRKAPIALRFDSEGRVQTSHGATVPALSALKLWELATRAKRNGQALEGINHTVGFYKLNKIDESGNVTIGCHYITFEAMQSFAPLLLEIFPQAITASMKTVAASL